MKVRFYRQRPEGPQKIGTIALINGVLVPAPADSIALQSVLNEPARYVDVDHDDQVTLFDSRLQPKEFLEALPAMYHGSYFWASKVED